MFELSQAQQLAYLKLRNRVRQPDRLVALVGAPDPYRIKQEKNCWTVYWQQRKIGEFKSQEAAQRYVICRAKYQLS